MKQVLTVCVLALCLSATGCLELMQGYTLNPDGSGKVVLDTVSPARKQLDPQNKEQKPEEVIRQTIEERLSKGKGIEAWSDITCELTQDGKVHFRGTAYFADVNQLDPNDSGGGGTISWKKQGNAMVLTMQNNTAKPEGGPQAALTDAQIEEKLKQEKIQFQQMKPLIGGMLTGMKVQITAKLPGVIAESNIFEAKGDTATLTMTGQQMIAAMEKVNARDELLRAKIKAGPGKGEDDFMFEQIFGKKGPAMVKVTGASKPQFDYKAEVAKAKAGEAAMYMKLGVTPPGNAQPK